MAQQFLDYAGLQEFWSKIKTFVATNYVAKSSVDSALSSTSTNPVQNKVVYTAINTIASAVDNKVSFTATKTSGDKIGTITIDGNATDIYSDSIPGASAGIQLAGGEYKHTNSVTAKTAYGSTATTASANGGTIKVTDVKYDGQGHITGSTDRTITLSQDHTKTSITAGTAGTSSATNGATLAVPYVTMNANGHVTAYGTHTHTISGFATSSEFSTLSGQVSTNTSDIATLKGSVAGGVHFIGVKTELPSTAINGDVCIVGEKEYIYSKPEGSTTGSWVELGDTSSEAQRLTAIENSYVSSFGGKKGAITVDTTSTDVGKVKFAMSSNKLTGSVNVGATSFGGKTGDITVASGSTTTGAVNFAMSNNQLTGTVVLPTIVSSVQGGATDTVTVSIDTTTGGSATSPKITATANTEAPTSGSKKLVTSGQVYTYVTNSINGLDGSVAAATPAQGTAETTAVAIEKPFTMVTSVTQTNGKVSVGTTELGPIPISAITALS